MSGDKAWRRNFVKALNHSALKSASAQAQRQAGAGDDDDAVSVAGKSDAQETTMSRSVTYHVRV